MNESAWAKNVLEKLEQKMQYGVKRAKAHDYIPYTVKNGDWAPTKIDWWTNGFWPAEMWQMYLETGNALYREEAIRAEKMMDEALRDFTSLHHDVGFMWLISSGVHYALEKNPDSLNRLLFAGNMLAGRYNPNGFIRAWNHPSQCGYAIIDCMMNLSLLFWASRQTGDPRFAHVAKIHAETTMREFVRENGSVSHIIEFDPETGARVKEHPGQGYALGTSWSRGQAWGLYGFTLAYANTKNEEYLKAACRIADYFTAHIREDGLTDCDFCQPADEVRIDNIAGACAACGLQELAKLSGNGKYQAAAERLEIKAQRMAQRKREQLQHEKNLRQGKRRTAEAAAEKNDPPEAHTAPKRPAGQHRRDAPTNRFAGSRPVKKGKGSVRKKK